MPTSNRDIVYYLLARPLNFYYYTEVEFMDVLYNFVEVSGHNLESSQTLRFPCTMFTLQTSFKSLLIGGGGGSGGRGKIRRRGDCE